MQRLEQVTGARSKRDQAGDGCRRCQARKSTWAVEPMAARGRLGVAKAGRWGRADGLSWELIRGYNMEPSENMLFAKNGKPGVEAHACNSILIRLRQENCPSSRPVWFTECEIPSQK